ncbi:MAG: excisionase family DNA-binding protein [Solirubrobacterales bacterium]
MITRGHRSLGDTRDWLTTESPASRLKVSDRLIRKWVQTDLLRSCKFGSLRRFAPADVDDFVVRFLDDRRGGG